MARLRDVNFVQLGFMEMLLNIQSHSALLATATIKAQLPLLTTTRSIPSLVTIKASVLAWKMLLETSATAAEIPTGMWAQELAVSSVCAIPLAL